MRVSSQHSNTLSAKLGDVSKEGCKLLFFAFDFRPLLAFQEILAACLSFFLGTLSTQVFCGGCWQHGQPLWQVTPVPIPATALPFGRPCGACLTGTQKRCWTHCRRALKARQTPPKLGWGQCGCGSKLNRRGYAGFGPCFQPCSVRLVLALRRLLQWNLTRTPPSEITPWADRMIHGQAVLKWSALCNMFQHAN